MRKFIVLIILFLGVVVVITSFSELEQTVETLQKGNFWFILLAVLIQFCWFILVGITYRSLYRLLGMQESIFNLAQMAAAATFVNYVMPTAGVGGIAVFVNASKKRGEKVGHSTGKITWWLPCSYWSIKLRFWPCWRWESSYLSAAKTWAQAN